MYYHLLPLLRKRPDKIILHISTNDALHIKADEMLEELGKLKSLILEMLPSVKIILSAPTIRVGKYIMQMKTTSILLNCFKQMTLYGLNTRTLKKTIWTDMVSILTTTAPES